MAWLVRDEQLLAAVEVASTPGDRMRGLLGRDGVDGALLLQPARSVHTIGMRFAIDVAFCDRELRVLRVVTMAPNRIGPPVRRSRAVLEAEAGRMRGWDLRPGDRLAIRDVDPGAGSPASAGGDGRVERAGPGPGSERGTGAAT